MKKDELTKIKDWMKVSVTLDVDGINHTLEDSIALEGPAVERYDNFWVCSGTYMKYTIIAMRHFKIIEDVYRYSLSGGNLHVQLSDNNLKDEFFEEYKIYLDDTTEEQKEAEIKCFNALKKLSYGERCLAVDFFNKNMEYCK